MRYSCPTRLCWRSRVPGPVSALIGTATTRPWRRLRLRSRGTRAPTRTATAGTITTTGSIATAGPVIATAGSMIAVAGPVVAAARSMITTAGPVIATARSMIAKAWSGRTWTVRRRRPMHPITLALIPRAAPVVAAPVIADAERNHADAELRSKFQYRHPPAVVVVKQVIAVHPAAIALPIDIAPGPIVETSADIHQHIRRNRRDHRILRTGTGAQMHDALGVGRTRGCDAANADRDQCSNGMQVSTHGSQSERIAGSPQPCGFGRNRLF
jgi:hypothetical protein